MGNAGKWEARRRARSLRAEGWTVPAIAAEVGVARSTAARWCAGIAFVPGPEHRSGSNVRSHPLKVRRLEQAARLQLEATTAVGMLSDRDLLMYGLGLYHGEGSKTDRDVRMANTSAAAMLLFVTWLRRCIGVDESRLRARLYLHEGLDVDEATRFWSELLYIPVTQFRRPHRPIPRDGSPTKHPMGCATVVYSDAATHRRVMALIEAVSSSVADPG